MRRLVPVLVLAFGLGVAACGVGSDEARRRALPPLTRPTTTTTSPPTTTTVEDGCTDEVALESYAPLPTVPTAEEAAESSPLVRAILDHHMLVVAVDENTKYLAARNPRTADLEGAEIEIAKRIAQRIFGGALGDNIQFKTVTTKEKLAFPEEKKADLSISAISMTCERWHSVDFSSTYLTARHQYLVRRDSEVKTTEDIAGRRVCVTKGSTSIDLLHGINDQFEQQGREPAVVVPVDARTDCLLQVQEGMVDAYLGHDTFLRGMLEQNPGLTVIDQGAEQHYGIAIAKDNTYFVQYVNAVLQEMRQSGELQQLLDIAGKEVPPVGETRQL